MSGTLAVAACAWLLASWLLQAKLHGGLVWIVSGALRAVPGGTLLGAPVETRPPMAPMVRWMMQSVLLGIGLAWPAWRLSIRRPKGRRIGAEVLADAVVLLAITKLVVWVMPVHVDWSKLQTLLVDATLTVWLLPIALWIYLGRHADTEAARAGFMGLCVATLLGGGPAAVLFQEPVEHWSPIYALWVLSEPGTGVPDRVVRPLVVVAAASLLGWLAAVLSPTPRPPGNPNA